MELVIEAGLVPEGRLFDLMKEVNEILVMAVSSIKTARRKK
jgi:hypothetical protein